MSQVLVDFRMESESNMKYLDKVISEIDSGEAKLVEHDLIEE